MADDLATLHRRAQARLGALTVAEVDALWHLLDFNDLDRTAPIWLAAVLGVVTVRREQSSALARSFLREHRALMLPNATPLPPAPPTPVPVAAIATSMRVTGPVAIKAAMTRGAPRSIASQAARTMTARSAERHTLDGGREVVVESTANDPRSTGWRRDKSAGACKFCSASENQQGSGAFRRHDGCHCSPVPAYD